MRARAAKDGLTLRVIAGTTNALLTMDLDAAKRPGCLGFSIERTDLDTGDRRWLPNMLRFPSDPDPEWITTARAPLQKFRWGDYTLEPGKRYRYRVIARFGGPAEIIRVGNDSEKRHAFDNIPGGVTVEIKTEDGRLNDTAVFFNRGAAASEAYVRRFGQNDPAKIPEALSWLSRGLEEAAVAFLSKAPDSEFALHAAIYEFQKSELLRALKSAQSRGVNVVVAYHARAKNADDKTAEKNMAAIAAEKIDFAKPRKANPQGAIMHNKFVVLLKKNQGGKFDPVAVWTGSTNWTEGAIYGQLNVGHAIYDAGLAAKYEKYFQLLLADSPAATMKQQSEAITPVPTKDRNSIAHGITPIFSPQSDLSMIELYADVCQKAKVLLVCAPFELHEKIRTTFDHPPPGVLRFLMADKAGSFGKKGEMELIQRDPGNKATVATVLNTPLNDFQGRLLEHAESFHHAGVHIHAKIIASDPFSSDPVLVTGSANYSNNSTTVNDENSLIIRGDTAVMDIYSTDFMRMFEHYWFRARVAGAVTVKGKKAGTLAGLREDSTWTDKYYVAGSQEMLDRLAFAGLVS